MGRTSTVGNEYTYDNLQRLRSLENKKIGNILLSSYEYELGPTGVRERIIENDGTSVDTLDYDEVYRLLEEQRSGAHAYEIEYEYDAVGNRLKKFFDNDTTRYEYNERDQLLNEVLNNDTTFYDYDNNGNTIKKDDGSQITDYSYDAENRLLKAEQNGSLLSEYLYDPDGNKIKLITPADTTHFLIDPNQPLAQVLAEYNNSGNLIVSYLHGDDLISQNRGGTKNYYHYDGLGSTRLLTDASALITNCYTYYAFGEILYALTPVPNAFMFTGEQFDPNLGFYYLRARLYNPAIGRFLTTDPFQGSIYDPMSLHKYLYCNGDPINYTDPTGLINWSLTGVMVSIVIFSILCVLNLTVPLGAPSVIGNLKTKSTRHAVWPVLGISTGHWGFGWGTTTVFVYELDEQNNVSDVAMYSVIEVSLGLGIPTVTSWSSYSFLMLSEPKDCSEFVGWGTYALTIEGYVGVGASMQLSLVVPNTGEATVEFAGSLGVGMSVRAGGFMYWWFRKYTYGPPQDFRGAPQL